MKTHINIVVLFICRVALVTSDCYDQDPTFCQTMVNDQSGMCEESCFADFCKKTCNKCPLTCRECYGIDRPEDCDNVVSCPGIDYECAISKGLNVHFKESYMLGCSKKEYCSRHTTAARTISVPTLSTIHQSTKSTTNIPTEAAGNIPSLLSKITFRDLPTTGTSVQNKATSISLQKTRTDKNTDSSISAKFNPAKTSAGVNTPRTRCVHIVTSTDSTPGLKTKADNNTESSLSAKFNPAETNTGVNTPRTRFVHKVRSTDSTTPSDIFDPSKSSIRTGALHQTSETNIDTLKNKSSMKTSPISSQFPTTVKTKSSSTLKQVLIGKRSALGEVTCCSTDNCNQVHPSKHVVDKRSTTNEERTRRAVNSTTCIDANTKACIFLYLSIPDICTKHPCVANSLCPRLCAVCPECYQCNYSDRIEDCTSTKICSRGQKCVHMETKAADSSTQYTLGCMNQEVCKKFDSFTHEIIGMVYSDIKGGCCSGNRCNRQHITTKTTKTTKSTKPVTSTTTRHTSTPYTKQHPTTTSKPTTIVHRTTTSTSAVSPTTAFRTTVTTASTHSPIEKLNIKTTLKTPTSTIQPECLHRPSQCPQGFAMTAHGCFIAQRTKMDWNSAKIFCKSKCAMLADFNNEQEIHDVINEMTHTHGDILYHHSVEAFVDGYYRNGQWSSSTRQNISRSLTSHFHHLSKHHDYCMIVSTKSGEGRRRRDSNSNGIVQTTLKAVSCGHHYYPLCKYTKHLKHYYDPVSLNHLSNTDDDDD